MVGVPSLLLRPAVALAAATRKVVQRHEPSNWTAPRLLMTPEVLSDAEVATAEAELAALYRLAVEPVRRARTEWASP